MRHGVARAEEALHARKMALKRRSVAVARAARSRRPRAAAPALAPRLKRAAGPVGSAGTLVAEGDSWFDYPLWDVLKMLEDEHGFDVESVAHKGDRVEDMAYGPGQLDAFCRLCGHFKRELEQPVSTPVQSDTWRRAYTRWAAARRGADDPCP